MCTGIFDGLGYTIDNLTINRPGTNPVGLFGISNGTITNIALEGGTVSGRSAVGALIGDNLYGSVSNAYAVVSVSGNDSVGGLAGVNGGTISKAYATGDVNGGATVGGLAGANYGYINDAYATGNVTGGDQVGGLAGLNLNDSGGEISNAYATGNVIGNNKVGGLVGRNDLSATISNTYATGSVTGTGNVGGLVGVNDNFSITSNSYYSGTSNQADNAWGTRRSTDGIKEIATFTGWDISNVGGDGKTWRIYEGQTAPLLRSFLTPLTLTPDYDGSGNALTNIGSVSAPAGTDSSKILGTQTGNSLTLTSPDANGYVATADVTGLYSTQQGYDISAARTIATPGSAAGDIQLPNGVDWTNGTLNVNGHVTDAGAVNSSNGVFNQLGGTWTQVNSNNAAFEVEDFRISGGTFKRFLGGDGTVASPYQIGDVYGLQGVGSAGMLSANYTLAHDIDASGTALWNSDGAPTPTYAGFKPLGDYSKNSNASMFTALFRLSIDNLLTEG